MTKTLTAILFLIGSPAVACLMPTLETSPFLPNLNDAAEDQPYVAEVRVLRTRVEGPSLVTDVLIIDPIQGDPHIGVVTIKNPNTSCARDHSLGIGDQAFIAGNLKDGVFSGNWKNGSQLVTLSE